MARPSCRGSRPSGPAAASARPRYLLSAARPPQLTGRRCQRRLCRSAAVGVAGHDQDLIIPGRLALPGTVEAVVPDREPARSLGWLGQRAHHRAVAVEDEDGHVRGLAQPEADGRVALGACRDGRRAQRKPADLGTVGDRRRRASRCGGTGVGLRWGGSAGGSCVGVDVGVVSGWGPGWFGVADAVLDIRLGDDVPPYRDGSERRSACTWGAARGSRTGWRTAARSHQVFAHLGQPGRPAGRGRQAELGEPEGQADALGCGYLRAHELRGRCQLRLWSPALPRG